MPCHVSGNGVTGQLTVDEHTIELDVRLGLALKLMEGPIRAAIERQSTQSWLSHRRVLKPRHRAERV